VSPLTKSLRQLAVEDLYSTRCACGGAKLSGQSFCHACFRELPPRMRNALYVACSVTYADAWDEAKDYLRIEAGRIK
jgi:hypothetical protein